MKYFYYILLLLFLSSKTILAQWYLQESGTTADLHGLWFVDSLNGWACGDSGIILNTSNGGKDWDQQNSTVTTRLEDIFFWDLHKGWIAGESGTIIHTTNSGISWNEQQTMVNNHLLNIQFVTPLKGFSSGSSSEYLLTEDSGITWQIIPGDTGIVSNLFYWNDEAVGTRWITNGILSLQSFTGDAGMTWSPPIVVGFYVNDIWGTRSPYDIFYWDVGKGGNALWIIDDGISSTAFLGQTEDTLDLYAVTMEREVEPIKLWSVGQQGWIINSIDTGQTWQTTISGISSDLNEVSFPLNNRGWAVGDSSVILRYDHPTSVKNSSSNIFASNIYILDAYPNPFNSSVTIQYLIPQSENISITIYNSLGQLVNNLFYGYQQSGNYEVNWDGTNEQGQTCSSDLYLTVLKTQHSFLSKKIILLK